MVAPTAFGFNEQAAADNHFMHQGVHTTTTTKSWEVTPPDDLILPLEIAGLVSN